MNKAKLNLLNVVVLLILLVGCKPSEVSSTDKELGNSYQLSKTQKVSFLTLDEGQKEIAEDDKEAFFERIGILDMEIQMKKKMKGVPREEVLKAYKEHLKASVLEFSKEDKVFIQQVFDKAYKLCNKVSKDIYPQDIRLIKTDMNHYGGGVYYTRENCIIIPKDALTTRKDSKDFMKTMLHEIYHIYSRYNPKKQAAMYKRIGYRKIREAAMPAELERRVLLNPDGVDYFMGIKLKDKETDEAFTAIPIIYSKQLNYTQDIRDFFGYLKFQLFKIKDGKVVTTPSGDSTIKINGVKGFYDQIGTNTQYIIHPDEVLADNFILMCLAKEDESILKEEYNIKPVGRQLIDDLEAIIKE